MNLFLCLNESPLVVVIRDLSVDDRFKYHPLVSGPTHLRFFAGATIKVHKERIGSICLVDYCENHEINEEKLIMTLTEISAMISDVLSERISRSNAIKAEQIRYMVGVTNHLKVPSGQILRLLQMTRNIVNNIKSDLGENDFKISISNLSPKIKKLIQNTQEISKKVTEMSNHLDRQLKLAYVSSETKRESCKLSTKRNTFEKIIYNPILHPSTDSMTLNYITLSALTSNLKEYIEEDYEIKPPNIQNFEGKSFRSKWSTSNDQSESVQLAVDEEMLKLVLHSILQPILSKEMNNNSLPYSVYVGIDEFSSLHISKIKKQISYSDLSPPSSPIGSLQKIKRLVITVKRLNNLDESSSREKKMIKQNYIAFLSSRNIVEYSQQSILKELMEVSNGEFDVYIPIQRHEDDSSLHQNTYRNKDLVFKVSLPCYVKSGYVDNSSRDLMSTTAMSSLRSFNRSDSLENPIDFTQSKVKFTLSEDLDKLVEEKISKKNDERKTISQSIIDKCKELPSLILPIFASNTNTKIKSRRNCSFQIGASCE